MARNGSGWQEPAGREVVTGDYCSNFFKMPVSCCAFDCTKRFIKGEGTKFYRSPCDPEYWRWLVLATKRRDWTPTEHSRICSNHFVEGRLSVFVFPSLYYYTLVAGRLSPDTTHVDYVPSIFSFKPRVALTEARTQRLARRLQQKEIEGEEREGFDSERMELEALEMEVAQGLVIMDDHAHQCRNSNRRQRPANWCYKCVNTDRNNWTQMWCVTCNQCRVHPAKWWHD